MSLLNTPLIIDWPIQNSTAPVAVGGINWSIYDSTLIFDWPSRKATASSNIYNGLVAMTMAVAGAAANGNVYPGSVAMTFAESAVTSTGITGGTTSLSLAITATTSQALPAEIRSFTGRIRIKPRFRGTLN